MTIDLTKYAVAVAVETESKPAKTDRTVEFCETLAKQGVRISYHGVHAIRYGKHTKGVPTYKPTLQALPIGAQWVICRKDGSYDKDAIAKWADVAPEGYRMMPVIPDSAVLEAYEAFLAAE